MCYVCSSLIWFEYVVSTVIYTGFRTIESCKIDMEIICDQKYDLLPQVYYNDITWAPWCLESLATQLFVQQLFRLTTEKNYHRFTLLAFVSDWWIPHTKGQGWCGFLSQKASNAESIPTSWCPHAMVSLLQYIPRNMHTVLLCFALLWLCNRS